MSCRKGVLSVLAIAIMAIMAFSAAPSEATAVNSMECDDVTFVLFSDGVGMNTAKDYPVTIHIYNSKSTAVTVKITDGGNSAINLSLSPNEFVLEGKEAREIDAAFTTDRYTSMDEYTITLVMSVMDGTNDAMESSMDIPVSVTSDYSSGEKFNRFFGIFDNNLPSPFNTAPAAAIITLIVWIGISIAIGLLSLFVLKSIFRVIDRDSDTLGKNTTIGVSVCVFLAGLINSAYIIGASEAVIDQLKTFTGILYILFVAMIVWDVYKALITGALQKMEKKNLGGGMDTSLIPLFKAIGKMVIILFCIALILSKFGVNFATLITSAGLTGLGLSFGVKPAINELFSGLIVLITRPFKVGDYVTVAGEGRYKVAEIGILRTEFDTGFTMETATMPNSKIASSKIVNISHRTLKYRNTISIKVPFNSNLTLIKKLVKKIASDHPDVVTDGSVPKPNAVFTSCNDGSAIIVTLSFYVRDFDVNATTTCKIREEILRVFRERGITIPLNRMEATIYRGGQSDA